MSDTYRGTGDTIQMVAPAGGVTSGTAYYIGDTLGVAVRDADAGAVCDFTVEGIFLLPAEATDVWAAGDNLLWDTDNDELTEDEGANHFYVGIAASAKASSETTALVKLVQSMGATAP